MKASGGQGCCTSTVAGYNGIRKGAAPTTVTWKLLAASCTDQPLLTRSGYKLLVKEVLTNSDEGLRSDPAEPHVSFRVTAGGSGTRNKMHIACSVYRGAMATTAGAMIMVYLVRRKTSLVDGAVISFHCRTLPGQEKPQDLMTPTCQNTMMRGPESAKCQKAIPAH
jgi:hypothetical protein